MNLILEEAPKTRRKSYNIKDETGSILYTFKKSPLGKNYKVYDDKKHQVAEIKQTLFSNCLYKIYANGDEIDQVTTIAKVPLRKYELEKNKWSIEGDITFSSYCIYDDKDNKIIELNHNILKETYDWNIKIIDKKEELLSALAIIVTVSISIN